MKQMQKEKLKQKLQHEMYLYVIYATFLTFFFSSLITYQRLILGQYSISYLHYGYGLIEGLILAKIILIGESLGLGEKFKNDPLIIPTLYKAMIFTLFVMLFTIIEHFITGIVHEKGTQIIFQELINQGKDQILAKSLVVFLVFIIFFAFIETGNVLGEGNLLDLFFSKKSKGRLP